MFRAWLAVCFALIPAVLLAQTPEEPTYVWMVRGTSTKDPTDRAWDVTRFTSESDAVSRIKELKHDYYDRDGLLYATTDKPVGLYSQKYRVTKGVLEAAARPTSSEAIVAPEKPGDKPGNDNAPAAPEESSEGWVVQVSDLKNGVWVQRPLGVGRWEFGPDQQKQAQDTYQRISSAIDKLKKRKGSLKVELLPWNPNHLKKPNIELPTLPLVDPGPSTEGTTRGTATLSRADIETKLTGPWQTDFGNLLRSSIWIIAKDGMVEVSSGGGTGNSYYDDEKGPLKNDGSFTFVMKAGFANKQGDITGEGRLDGEKLSITMRRNGEVTTGTMVKKKNE